MGMLLYIEAEAVLEGIMMTLSYGESNDFELVHGSGNVYQDLKYPDSDIRQAKAVLAAEIIKVLDTEKLSTRQAEAKTGVNHSEFSRIRQTNLDRFTIDRLISILIRLGRDVQLSIVTKPQLSKIL